MNEQGPNKPKTQEELEAEFEKIEDSIVELARQLDGLEVERLEGDFMKLAKSVEDGETEITEAIIQAKEILKKLEAFTS